VEVGLVCGAVNSRLQKSQKYQRSGLLAPAGGTCLVVVLAQYGQAGPGGIAKS